MHASIHKMRDESLQACDINAVSVGQWGSHRGHYASQSHGLQFYILSTVVQYSTSVSSPLVTMGEGNTPLVPGLRIGPMAGLRSLAFKLEICNPTGSYKDRFIAAELTHWLPSGARACVATSSGNTGSSLAAYCARYDIACTIVVNRNAPAGKLAQMKAHGARVLRVDDFVSCPETTQRVFAILQRYSAAANAPLIVSAYRYCPIGMAGVESLGREIAAAGNVRHVFVPVGGGGLFTAVSRGLADTGIKVHAVQPEGCSTVASAWIRGDDSIQPVQSRTRVSGLAVPFDIDASLALSLLRQQGGRAYSVTDEDIFEAQREMLRCEGIYCEPAGAAALAGVRYALAAGDVHPDDGVVCLVTGHGSKDPDSIAEAAAQFPDKCASADELAELLG